VILVAVLSALPCSLSVHSCGFKLRSVGKSAHDCRRPAVALRALPAPAPLWQRPRRPSRLAQLPVHPERPLGVRIRALEGLGAGCALWATCTGALRLPEARPPVAAVPLAVVLPQGPLGRRVFV
jgi:hypothetical protein